MPLFLNYIRLKKNTDEILSAKYLKKTIEAWALKPGEWIGNDDYFLNKF